MKLLNTVVITTLLSAGLAANAMAAPSNYDKTNAKKGAQKVVIVKQAPKKVAKKVVVKQVAQKVVKQTPKKVVSKTYRVRSGDTLTRIAAKNRTSVNQLIKINKLWGSKANNLKVGMVLRVA